MIDTRPDLAKLLLELNQYHCTFGLENQIFIEIPQFKNKSNEPWYGLMLICKPNRTSIEVYICKDNSPESKFVFIDSFDDIISLEDLISRSIEATKVCSLCGKSASLNNIYLHDSKHICKECNDKIRCKY